MRNRKSLEERREKVGVAGGGGGRGGGYTMSGLDKVTPKNYGDVTHTASGIIGPM